MVVSGATDDDDVVFFCHERIKICAFSTIHILHGPLHIDKDNVTTEHSPFVNACWALAFLLGLSEPHLWIAVVSDFVADCCFSTAFSDLVSALTALASAVVMSSPCSMGRLGDMMIASYW